jgi:hypothetical protein
MIIRTVFLMDFTAVLSELMLRSAQGLTLRQAANYQCGFPRGRGLTQGQALHNLA